MSKSATTPTSDTAPENARSSGQGKPLATCEWCRTDFAPPRRWSRFCKDACLNAHFRAAKLAEAIGPREIVRLALDSGFGDADWQAKARRLLGR